jgi:hypothetical protein
MQKAIGRMIRGQEKNETQTKKLPNAKRAGGIAQVAQHPEFKS